MTNGRRVMEQFGSAQRKGWAALSVVLLVQFSLQAYFFPLHELWSAKPLMHIDSAFHQYMMQSSMAYCRAGHLVGYDPYFHAGFLSGVVPDLSSKLQSLTACAFGDAELIPKIYKLFSFVLGVAGPLLPILAAVLLGLEARAIAAVAVFALLMAWTGPTRWFHTAGMVSYVAAAQLAVLFAVLMRRACSEPSAPRVALASCAACMGSLLHPMFVVPAVLLAVPMMWSHLAGGGRWKPVLVACFVASAATLAGNLFWVWPWLTAPAYDIVIAEYQRVVDPLLVLNESLGIAQTTSGGSRLYSALLLASLPAMLFATVPQVRQMRAIGVGAAVLLVLASVGAINATVATLQPNRFSVAAWQALILPAGVGVVWLLRSVASNAGPRRWIALACTVPIAVVTMYFARDAWLELFAQRPQRYAVTRPEVKGDGALKHALVAALIRHTDRSARIFYETSLARIVDGAHVAGLLAFESDREFIGGPYPHTGYANAWDRTAFGKPLGSYSVSDLTRQLDLYNVGWMLCHTSACRQAMGALPGARKVSDIGPMTLYERSMKPNFFLVGAADVKTRCHGRLEIASGASEPLVLKYHWIPGLRASNGVRLEPHHVPGVPRPFIALQNPTPNVVIALAPESMVPCPRKQDG